MREIFHSARRRQWPRLVGQLVCLPVLAVMAGCGSPRPPAPPTGPATPMAWPPPPDEARVVYVQSLRRSADVGIKTSGLKRVVRWLIGSAQANEVLLKPFGIALDDNDNLCLTDTGANRVCFYDRVNQQWQSWERVGRTRFISPVAVVKKAGIFYVADSARGSVLAFKDGAKVLFEITNHLERPVGLTLAGERLLVVDSRRHAVVTFDLAGHFVSEFGRRGTGKGEFNFPTHIAADTDGRVLVTDSMNSRVQIFDPAGNFKGQLGSIGDSPGHFSRPKGAAVDTFGHIYVVDGVFDNIQVFNSEGRILLDWGAGGHQPGEFWSPNGIVISRRNEIFVTDSYNHRVQIFKYVGQQ